MERFFECGALDVTFIPCVMKKSRPGTIVSVLCSPEKIQTIRETMFKESQTIGFRETPVRRLSLRREQSVVACAAGEVHQKTVYFGEEKLRSKIEYEDRARVAREQGVSLSKAANIIESKAEGKK
jgi:uncharacterized protein (DUF111 family)